MLEKDSYLANTLVEIERSAAEAMQIVQENLSHLRPIAAEKVHIAARVAEAIQAAQVPDGIKVITSGLDDLPTVIAGGQSLTLVFRNLIENAIAAMQGNGLITIHGDSLREWVEISVTDSGPGISPELHSQIFEIKFFRTPPIRTREIRIWLVVGKDLDDTPWRFDRGRERWSARDNLSIASPICGRGA